MGFICDVQWLKLMMIIGIYVGFMGFRGIYTGFGWTWESH